uniref:Uncharacterized protein n=1 Tax=Arundo donax TaxID=35708 RepID=A0A0A9EP76_ARUDO
MGVSNRKLTGTPKIGAMKEGKRKEK